MNSQKQKEEEVTIYKYNYHNPVVKKIERLVKDKYSFLFFSVIVHGSLATNEEVEFSDFDGLLILKDSWIKSKELESFKKESFRIILKYDPLQHHGWFELKESDLSNYPNNYLPISVLRKSKLIFPNQLEFKLKINPSKGIDYNKSLETILISIKQRIKKKWRPKNMFQLKSFLSQIMLIPCLFYSALKNKGIFKKDSFVFAKPFFSEEEWSVIKLCSKARKEWHYDLGVIQKKLMTVPNKTFRKVTKKYLSPPIDKQKFDYVINDDFMRKLMLFINKVQTIIKETK